MKPKAPLARCEYCTLRQEPFVPSSGKFNATLVVVGEAPGATEVDQGKPFVGPSGQLLDAAIAQAQGNPVDSYRTNVVLCRPEGNRDPSELEVSCCLPRLLDELRKTKGPILALGSVASTALGIPFNQQGAWVPWDEGRWVKPAWHPAYVLRKADEATVFLKEVESAVLGPEKRRLFNPEVRWATSAVQLEELLQKCPSGSWVAFDLETDQVQWYDTPIAKRDGILMLQLAWSYDFGIVVPDDLLYDSPKAQQVLRDFFSRVKTVGHNAKFDTVFMRSHLDIAPHLDFDTMLAQYVLDETMPLGLKKLASLYFGIPDYEAELISGYLSSRNDRYSKVPPEKLGQYGVLDVVVTLAFREVFEKMLRESGQYEMPFEGIIMPATRMFENAELRGMQVDEGALEYVGTELQKVIEQKLAELREVSGHPDLNPNSTQQMSALFYDELKLPGARSRKAGPRSTGADAIERLRGMHPIVEILEEFRRAHKLYVSYVKNVYAYRDLEGRVHANFMIHGTEVGRISVRDPALQTITRPDDTPGNYGGLIRGMYTAGPGKVLVIGDFSQAELRGLAAFSMDPYLLSVYRNDRDLHTEVAISIYGPNFTKEQRHICKDFNFSYVYGGTIYSFALGSGIPVTQAQDFVRMYDGLMPVAKQWKKSQYEEALANGWVETIFHRRRHFPLVTEDNEKDIRKACVHMVIAGTASDLDMMAASQLESEGIPIVLTVHDSVIAEVDEANAKVVGLRIHEVMLEMGNRYLPQVPWKVDVEIRHTWYGGSSLELKGGKWIEHD